MSFKPTDFILTQNQVSKGGQLILIGTGDDTEYVDGKSTGKRIGTKYTVVAPANKYTSFIVKVPDAKPLISQEEIDQYDQPILVNFTNFQGKFYYSNNSQNGFGFTTKADTIEIVKATK